MNTFIHFSLLKFYLFVYFIVYRNPIVLYSFLQKRYAHGIFAAGQNLMPIQEKKKDLGSYKMKKQKKKRKEKENLKVEHMQSAVPNLSSKNKNLLIMHSY